jgi:DNA-binding transcriptional ArsR family regulator
MHVDIEGFAMPEEGVVEAACDNFRILSDATRLRILWALAQGESSVACLAELSDASPTAVSQHLAKLRLAGLVRARRQGTYMFYAVVDPDIEKLLAAALGSKPPVRSKSKSKAKAS